MVGDFVVVVKSWALNRYTVVPLGIRCPIFLRFSVFFIVEGCISLFDSFPNYCCKNLSCVIIEVSLAHSFVWQRFSWMLGAETNKQQWQQKHQNIPPPPNVRTNSPSLLKFGCDGIFIHHSARLALSLESNLKGKLKVLSALFWPCFFPEHVDGFLISPYIQMFFFLGLNQQRMKSPG